MNTQSKNKTLVFIIVFLLLTNLLVLGYFLFSHNKWKRERGRDGFVTALQKEVGFNDEQVKKFQQLKETSWAEAKKKMDQIRLVKNNLFDLSKQPTVADSVIEKLADSIGKLQKQVEINTFNHFREIRAICTPEQQPAFDSLIKKIINRPGRGQRQGPSKK